MVFGVDEAGRGALAGPVVAACVGLPAAFPVSILKDSKKLSPKARTDAFSVLMQHGALISIGVVSHRTVDRLNVLWATMLAMEKAIQKHRQIASEIVIDGNRCPSMNLTIPMQAIVGGDATVSQISAASIVAKVVRDELMCRYDRRYPGYGFSLHKGYGTQFHYSQIVANGICAIHRKTFRLYGLNHV